MIVVIGAGICGLAAAYELSRRGVIDLSRDGEELKAQNLIQEKFTSIRPKLIRVSPR